MHRTTVVPLSSTESAGRPAPSLTAVPQPHLRLAKALWCATALAALLVFGPTVQAQPGAKPTISIGVNDSATRQMSTKKRIRGIDNQNDSIARVSLLPTLDSVVVVGLSIGQTTIILTDEDGKTDTFQVVVTRFDFEAIRRVVATVAPSGNIRVEAAGNGIILSGTVDRPEEIPLVESAVRSVVVVAGGAGGGQGGGARNQVNVINALRVGGVQQVQLDVVVAQVSRNELRNMNFNFLTSSVNWFLGSSVGNAVLQPASVGTPGDAVLSTVANPVTYVPAGTTNLLFGVLSNSANFFGFLQALRTEGVLKLMAEPRLVTMSGRPAEFLSGGEQAVPTAAGLGTAGVEFRPFGTSVIFLPIVLGNGKIHLEVQPEVSTLDPASGTVANGVVVAGRTTQRVRTTVELEVGQTFVIGGLIQHQTTGTAVRTPLLGDIPFVNTFFSGKTMNDQETELVIMVTPHLVDGQDCAQAPKCLPGSETRIPDDFELFLEGILEAPRGPRCICPGGHYVPAWKNDPTAGQFPCGEGACNGQCGNGCGVDGCGQAPCPTAPAAHSEPASVVNPVSYTEPAPVNKPTATKKSPRKLPGGLFSGGK